jgi:AcrR family transcriptional regulator
MKKQLSNRDKVMQTALQMVANGGFHASPMAELASVSGVAVGTIYHHFASKEDLMIALYLNASKNMSKALEATATSKLSPSKKVELMFLDLHAHLTKNALEFSFLDQFQSSPFAGHDAVESLFEKNIMDVFKEGSKAGKMKKLSPDVLAEYFYNAVATAVRMQLTTQRKKVSKKDAATFAEMAWNAIKK